MEKRYEEIIKRIIDEGYTVAGIRTLEDDENYVVGDDCRESYEWDLEHDCSTYFTTGETAGGTCATVFEIDDVPNTINNMIAAIESNNGYRGARQVVIAGHSTDQSFGHGDEDEVRIVDAVVVGIIK